MEEGVRIQSGDISLEGLLDRTEGNKGVVVTHPHPLYGGDMRNNVVEAIAGSYQKAGYTTLRFNFRGVGGSQGAHDNGEGEQVDVRAALGYLRGLGVGTLHLAGYSFGVWVNARLLKDLPDIESSIMISPPIDFMDFSFLELNSKIRLIVTGERDDIASAEKIKRLAPVWNPDVSLHIIPGADHFYLGFTGELQKILDGFLAHMKKSYG
jgi:alpha/beta superfamily hydrolase